MRSSSLKAVVDIGFRFLCLCRTAGVAADGGRRAEDGGRGRWTVDSGSGLGLKWRARRGRAECDG